MSRDNNAQTTFLSDMYKGDLAHSAARFLPRALFDSVGGYSESMIAGEDYDFQARLNARGVPTVFVNGEALHLGEPERLLPHLKKCYFYGADFRNFLMVHGASGVQQLGAVRFTYVRHWKRFVQRPGTAIVFGIYLCLKYVAGAAGLASTLVRARRVGSWGSVK